LAVLDAGPFIFFPLLEDLVEARRKGLIVDDLRVLARDLEGFGDEIENVFPNKHVGVQVGLIFFDRSANIESETKLLKELC
jgi:hypothetical protein